MKRERRQARVYILDLVNVCERLTRYLAGKSKSDFAADEMLQDAVLRNLEVFGEAAKQLQDNFPDAPSLFPSIPFQDMWLTRNRIIHGYAYLKFDVVFDTAIVDVIPLHPILEDILANWPEGLL